MKKSSWNPEKKCWRLIHPETGEFIAEYYPDKELIIAVKHKKEAKFYLKELTDGN